MKKILIVGYGSIGKRHTKNILSHTSHDIIILTNRKDNLPVDNKRIKIHNCVCNITKRRNIQRIDWNKNLGEKGI